MKWYLLKTWAGQEEKLAQEIRRLVPLQPDEEVFAVSAERVWRHQGHCVIHRDQLFPGCVFLKCLGTEPLARRLEAVPPVAALMASGVLTVSPLMERDAAFLRQITGEDHVIRLSYVLRETSGMPWDERKSRDGEQSRDEKIRVDRFSRYRVSGPLAHCMDDIAGVEFRRRFVKIRRKLWGEEQVIVLGILLREDLEETAAGRTERQGAPGDGEMQPSNRAERPDAPGEGVMQPASRTVPKIRKGA